MTQIINVDNKQIVFNGVQCLNCNVLIESTYRHDYKTCQCINTAFVDGGLSYVRWGAKNTAQARAITIYDTDKFSHVRRFAFRSMIDKKNNSIPVRLFKMDSEWLDNAIAYLIDTGTGPNWHLKLLLKEKQYRIENEIYVENEKEALQES